mmetsp:Transcript_630/g.844  ORF Transcript_630/g.844 Transcript_630/m.844 type:complete len:457 (-) Transcript_630:135-1505(-)|eukprot:CAMPEP_0172501530 /NCGR_PEP_ID=MMETSP1066-20121228/150648_1 /TAXON_ID=671091 /ORGANISM="Coscinodiscus wailesii, Strain CCMP2513" /LENGTH=456 /DNA_ID=CAMNT_0013276343 /DNA_START=64 /DNA_END=1434 /DNA_ORIENTATION=+
MRQAPPFKILLLIHLITGTTAFIAPQHQQPFASASCTYLSVFKPLAREGDWAAYLDEDDTGLVYYFNGKSGESSWDPPTSTFPPVTVPEPRVTKNIVSEKMAAAAEQGSEKLQGFFNQLTTTAKRAADNNVQEVIEEPLPEETTIVEPSPAPAAEMDVASTQTKSKNKSSFLNNIRSVIKMPTPTLSPESEATPTETDTVELKSLRVAAATKVLPHPAKISWGGEDAVFVRGRTFGVFDGVSGAEKTLGVPLYSRMLSNLVSRDVAPTDSLSIEQMQDLLLRAAECADSDATGASTALVASVGEDGYLRAINLGDSVLLVLREGQVVAKTEEIVHYFECPYQLSEDSPDRPRDAKKLAVEVLPGDIIVMGSDGVFDNLSDEVVCEVVESASSKARKGSKRQQIIANALVERSRKVSLDRNVVTPYSVEAKKNQYEDYPDGVGGKIDDVSCVVALCQ